MAVPKRIKGYLYIQQLRALLVLILLFTATSEVGAETSVLEVPFWSTMNSTENPLTSGNLTLEEFKIGIFATSSVVVKGSLSSEVGEHDHLWIAVKPHKSIENWWPQTGGPLPIINGSNFEGNAFLGGTCGDLFEIGILIVGDEINSRFSDWLNRSRSTNNWPPITEGSPGSDNRVSKKEIENNKYASITVILDEE